jgi:hypothetical protein
VAALTVDAGLGELGPGWPRLLDVLGVSGHGGVPRALRPMAGEIQSGARHGSP